MSYAAHRRDFGSYLDITHSHEASVAIAPKVGLFRRLSRWLRSTPRETALDKEASLLLSRSGGRFTDSLERAIEQRMMRSGAGWRG